MFALLISLLVSTVHGLMFELQPNGRQCLREEVQKDVLVTGEYEISEVPGQRTDVKVILFNKTVLKIALQLKYVFFFYCRSWILKATLL